jgi:enoyl-CoA hydratase/carnithine racemase
MSGSIKSHSVGATMVLTLSNPEQRNALGPEMYAAGVEAITAADGNPDVRSIIITGEGSNFCAGGNLQRLLGNRQLPPQVQADSLEGLNSWIESVRTCSRPVIAAVEGACAGAGFSLALACDFLLATQQSVFVMAYANIGLSPDGGGSWNLSRSVPRATAMQLMMLGERIDAERLHQLGLVNRVTEPGQALSEALAMAEKLNTKAPNALASIKELANEAVQQSLSQQLQLERGHFVRNLHHPNAGEGIQAFLDKRPARYR